MADLTRDNVTVKKDRTTIVRRKTTRAKGGEIYPVVQQIVYQEDGTTQISYVGDTDDFDNDPGKFNEEEPLVYNRNDYSDEAQAANNLNEESFKAADALILNNLKNKEVVKAERVGTGVYETKEIGDPKAGFYYSETREQKDDATAIISATNDETVIKGVAADLAKERTVPKSPDYKASKEKAAAEESKRKEAYLKEQDKKNGAYAKNPSEVPMKTVRVNGIPKQYPVDWTVREVLDYELSGDAPAGKSSPDGTPATGGNSSQDTDSSERPTAPEEELSPEQKAMEKSFNEKASAMGNSYDQQSAAADAVVSANDTTNAAINSDTASQKALESRKTSDPVDEVTAAYMSKYEAGWVSSSELAYKDKYGSAGLDKVQQEAATENTLERAAALEEGTLPQGSTMRQEVTSREAMKVANAANKNTIVEKKDVFPTVAGGTPQTPPGAPDTRSADYYRRGKESLPDPGYEIAPREFIPIDIKDSPSSLRVFGKGHGNGKSVGTMRDLIPAYSKFIIEGVSENRTERSQIVETFGDFYVFMFGERPSVMNFNCQLLNGANINWLHDFMFMYDAYLRGTRCVEQNASCIVTYGGKQVSGLILNVSAQINAAVEGAVAMSFSLVVFERNYFYYSPDMGIYTNSAGVSGTWEPLVKTLATIANPEGKGMAARNASIANKFTKKTMEGAPAKGPISFPTTAG